MSNKYLGHTGGLIGPVTMEKPCVSKLTYTALVSQTNQYEQHLSSLPIIPCEGWVPEVGKAYVENIHFVKQYQYYRGDVWCNCGLDFFMSFNIDKRSSFGRIVAVLLPAATDKEEKYEASKAINEIKSIIGKYWDDVKCVCDLLGRGKCELNCLEHEENQTPAISQPAANDGGDGKEFLSYVKKSRYEFTSFISSFEWRTDLRTAIDSLLICFDQMADRLQPPTYPAELKEDFVVITDFKGVNENYPDEHSWVGEVKILGIVVSAKTKELCIEEIIKSFRVLLYYKLRLVQNG